MTQFCSVLDSALSLDSLRRVMKVTQVSIGGGFAGINEINYNDNVE